MALTKSTTRQTLFAITSVASNTPNVGSAVDVSAVYAASGRVLFGRATATAFTTAPRILLQGTALTSAAANDWFTMALWTPSVGATIGSQAVSGTAAAGATSVVLAAGTNFASGDFLFFHNTTLANSEWKRFDTLATATFTLPTGDGLVNAQTGATVRNQAEEYFWTVDLTAINQIRLVVDAYGTGQAMVVFSDFGESLGL